MIEENLKKVQDEISEACIKSGRNLAEIKLIAVSKTQPISLIKEAVNLNIFHFGENKAQELKEKSSLIHGNFFWHFIGHLQSNKVKYIINSSEFIHSLDSVKLAEEINSKAEKVDKVQKVLLEIKTSDEATKYGLQEEKEILNLLEFCSYKNNLKVVGLMTMAPYTDEETVIRNSFSKLRNLLKSLNSRGFELKELSMGMTNDFKIAIQEGATMLRIGSAIFGERNYN